MIMLGYKETFRLLSARITVDLYQVNQLQTNSALFFLKFQDEVLQECIVEEPLNTFYSQL